LSVLRNGGQCIDIKYLDAKVFVGQENVMTQASLTPVAGQGSAAPRKGVNIALWVLQALLALAFVGAASGKLIGKPEMVGLFEAIGIGQWFRYVTGLLELAGAVLIVVPRTKFFGAALLALVMVGAVLTHLFILHNAPTVPVVLLVLAGVVAWARRGEVTP
jgi:putative oxidoreductase